MKTQRILWIAVLAFLLSGTASALTSSASTQEKTFKVEKNGKLEVSVDGSDITIVTWDKFEVFVKATGIDEDELEDLEINQSGNTVTVEFHPGWNGSSNVHFKISVPTDFNVDLRTSGGDISIKDKLTGEANAKTSGGNVEVGVVAGNCVLKTSGGDISASSIEKDAEISTSGGNIYVKKVGGNLKGSTAGGNISIGDVGGEATVSTAGGNIDVAQVSGSATLKTAGGDIDLKGATGKVVAKTAGGSLSLQAVYGSIEGTTAGGDVNAELNPTGKGKSSLKTAGGDVKLKIADNAKATIDALIRVNRKSDIDDYDIISDFEAAEYKKDKDAKRIVGKYLINGGGEAINLETAGGNIEIRKMKGK